MMDSDVSIWRILFDLEIDTELVAFVTPKNNILSFDIVRVKVLKVFVKGVHRSDNLFIELIIWSESQMFNPFYILNFPYILEIIIRGLSDAITILRSRTRSIFFLIFLSSHLTHLRMHLILTWWYLWIRRGLLMLIVWRRDHLGC